MYLKKTTYENTPEFLAAAHCINFTTTVSDVGVTRDEHGKKYVVAGTILDVDGKVVAKNGSSVATKAVAGILYHAVDVTAGPEPGALMVEGYVHEARLMQSDEAGVLNEEIKTSLKTQCPKITLR